MRTVHAVTFTGETTCDPPHAPVLRDSCCAVPLTAEAASLEGPILDRFKAQGCLMVGVKEDTIRGAICAIGPLTPYDEGGWRIFCDMGVIRHACPAVSAFSE